MTAVEGLGGMHSRVGASHTPATSSATLHAALDGAVPALQDALSAYVVGSDIGCGMALDATTPGPPGSDRRSIATGCRRPLYVVAPRVTRRHTCINDPSSRPV
jgi:hypothetical protein